MKNTSNITSHTQLERDNTRIKMQVDTEVMKQAVLTARYIAQCNSIYLGDGDDHQSSSPVRAMYPLKMMAQERLDASSRIQISILLN